jgi:hypothetical protein
MTRPPNKIILIMDNLRLLNPQVNAYGFRQKRKRMKVTSLLSRHRADILSNVQDYNRVF